MTGQLHEAITEYLISPVPPEHRHFRQLAIWVRWLRDDRWCLTRDRSSTDQVFTVTGELVPYRLPDDEDPHAPTTRFDLQAALTIARTIAAQDAT